MRKTAVMFGVAIALAVATIVGLAVSTGPASALPPADGFKCYKVAVQASDSTGSIHYIRDQFVERDEIFKKPIDYCSLAIKGGDGGGQSAGTVAPASDLVCYGIKDVSGQPRWLTQSIQTEDQFNQPLQLEVTKPLSVCETAEKLETIHPSGSTAGAPPRPPKFEFKCYTVRRHENGEPPDVFSISLDDQFSAFKDVRISKPVVFCTRVIDKKDVTNDNDKIEDAEPIEAPVEVHQSTLTATRQRADPHIPNCSPGGYGHSVWFTYTPATDVDFHLDVSDSTFDAIAVVFRGKPGNLDEVTCTESSADITLEGNTKYFILAASFQGGPGGKLKMSIDAQVCTVACPSGAGSAVSAAGLSIRDSSFVCYSLGIAGPRNTVIETKDQITFNKMRIGRQDFYCTPAHKCETKTQDLQGQVEKCFF